MRSKTYYKRLKAVFPDEEPELSALLARMSALYEDLRIEHAGATTSAKIELFDALPSIYRKFYFLRRSTITLVEFASAFQYLQQRPEFRQIRKRFSDKDEARWKAADEFFDKDGKKFERVKYLRHEFGGHFKLSTVRRVLKKIESDLVSGLEIVSDDLERVAGPRLPYSYDLIVTVISMERPPLPEGVEEIEHIRAHAREVFEMITEGWRHAVNTMHALVAHHVLLRFR